MTNKNGNANHQPLSDWFSEHIIKSTSTLRYSKTPMLNVNSNQQPLSDWIHTEMSNYIEKIAISP